MTEAVTIADSLRPTSTLADDGTIDTTKMTSPLANTAATITTLEVVIGDASDGKTGHQVTLQTAAIDVALGREIEMPAHTNREDPDRLLRSESAALTHR